MQVQTTAILLPKWLTLQLKIALLLLLTLLLLLQLLTLLLSRRLKHDKSKEKSLWVNSCRLFFYTYPTGSHKRMRRLDYRSSGV